MTIYMESCLFGKLYDAFRRQNSEDYRECRPKYRRFFNWRQIQLSNRVASKLSTGKADE